MRHQLELAGGVRAFWCLHDHTARAGWTSGSKPPAAHSPRPGPAAVVWMARWLTRSVPWPGGRDRAEYATRPRDSGVPHPRRPRRCVPLHELIPSGAHPSNVTAGHVLDGLLLQDRTMPSFEVTRCGGIGDGSHSTDIESDGADGDDVSPVTPGDSCDPHGSAARRVESPAGASGPKGLICYECCIRPIRRTSRFCTCHVVRVLPRGVVPSRC